MIDAILVAVGIARLWYAVPLLVSISLVYAATRHELTWPILEHAVRFAFGVLIFMLIIMGILILLSWSV
ncbi:MAG: hypothetical protein JW829_06020 [Pirellulales bacterium]|nr:hypothetical protein [Pirellulales bacterium]